MFLDGKIKGRAGEHVVLQSNGKFAADWALFVGGGKWHGLSKETHASLVRHLLSVARQAGLRKLSLALNSHEEVNLETLKEQVAEALATEGDNFDVCLLSCDAPVAVSAS
jgi:hypothetical protein